MRRPMIRVVITCEGHGGGYIGIWKQYRPLSRQLVLTESMSGGMVLFFTVHFALFHPADNIGPFLWKLHQICLRELGGVGGDARFLQIKWLGPARCLAETFQWRRRSPDVAKRGEWEGAAVSVYPGEGWCNPSAWPLTSPSVRLPAFLHQLLSLSTFHWTSWRRERASLSFLGYFFCFYLILRDCRQDVSLCGSDTGKLLPKTGVIKFFGL